MKSNLKITRPLSRMRRGGILPLVAVCLAALLILVAFMVNVAWISMTKTKATAAADLAAMSALYKYIEDAEDPDVIQTARDVGANVLQRNRVGLSNSALQPDRIEFGFLNDDSVHDPVFVVDETQVSSARVLPDPDFELPLFFGNILGRDAVDINSGAVTTLRKTEFVLCLDASRSMVHPPEGDTGDIAAPPSNDSKWAILTFRTNVFLEELAAENDGVEVSLVTFGGGLVGSPVSPLDLDQTRNEIPLTTVVNSASQIQAVMDRYAESTLGYGSFISDSLEASIDVLQAGDRNAAKVILLLSDGAQGTGRQNRPLPVVAAARAKRLGYKIHTINFQDVANPELLAVSTETRGLHFDAGNNKELRTAFRELLDEFSIRLAD